MDDAEKLLPCPFRGTDAKMWCAAGSDGKEWYVQSSVCRIGPYRSKAEAVAAWNTRLAAEARTAPAQEVLARAEAWLRECSLWLLTNDLDMKCPMDTDPLDLADDLAALSQGRDALVEALELAASRFEHCANMMADSHAIRGTLRAERTTIMRRFALETRAAVKDATQ